MCFSSRMSFALALLGIGSAGIVWRKTRNRKMTIAILFFCLMEFLQSIQYFFIAPNLSSSLCANRMNQFLTILGYVHIQFQPYFTNLYFQSFRPACNKAYLHEDIAWTLVQRLALTCTNFFSSFLIRDLKTIQQYYAVSNDWIEGPTLCTYRGSFHLAWSIPLMQSTYFLPGLGLHFFIMFFPVLCIGGLTEFDSTAFLFISGPLLATFISNNPHESASIWCFFSTLQCAIGATSAILQSKNALHSRQKTEQIPVEEEISTILTKEEMHNESTQVAR